MSDTTSPRRALVLDPAGTATARAIAARLRAAGHAVETAARVPAEPAGPYDVVVHEPGLLDDEVSGRPAEQLVTALDLLGPRLRPREHGGCRVVVVASRDGLGWPSRPDLAAESGALISTARSLALRLGRTGTTVNVIAALPPEGSPLRDSGRPENTHLYEPEALTPHPVTAQDIAETAAFLVDARSGYVTGQVLYVCGGASLLSSLSV
ncbi:SDR family oxidoreductase [Streptomyces sp. NPDC047706]|uniref:SDR family oxidoreductase n=1 Tax=Streptomyces sp. NPDC047706 TaxID=3365486 RepID=UPI0037106CBF